MTTSFALLKMIWHISCYTYFYHIINWRKLQRYGCFFPQKSILYGLTQFTSLNAAIFFFEIPAILNQQIELHPHPCYNQTNKPHFD
jgi:hypothetical protein